MKFNPIHLFASLVILGLSTFMLVSFKSQQTEPWTQRQLAAPQDLALTLNAPMSHQPIVLSVGPAAVIKNSIDIGPAKDAQGIDKLKRQLIDVSKDETIILYCGCCPFDKCPNIRPAFELLTQMQFKNHKLLNLPHNIKMDWIDRGYPVSQ